MHFSIGTARFEVIESLLSSTPLHPIPCSSYGMIHTSIQTIRSDHTTSHGGPINLLCSPSPNIPNAYLSFVTHSEIPSTCSIPHFSLSISHSRLRFAHQPHLACLRTATPATLLQVVHLPGPQHVICNESLDCRWRTTSLLFFRYDKSLPYSYWNDAVLASVTCLAVEAPNSWVRIMDL